MFFLLFLIKNKSMSIKSSLFEQCEDFVQKKEALVLGIIEANRKALEQESKSTAGDKHETGRAMLHLEMEKASQQLQVVEQMKEVLQRIQPTAISDQVKLGSLVRTNKGSYYLSISAGQIELMGQVYYAVSTQSPIGKILLGKNVNQRVVWGGNSMLIETIE